MEDISTISFKNNKESHNVKVENNNSFDDAPKTLLKNFKNSSPTNQERRENNISSNNRFTDKEDLNNQNLIKLNNVQDINANKNFNKQETGMSFGRGYTNSDDNDSTRNKFESINIFSPI